MFWCACGRDSSVKIYVTNKALTRGIVETEATLFSGASGGVAVASDGKVYSGYDWFKTLPEAKDDFDRRKKLKMEELAGRMRKLKALKPKVVKARR